MMFWSSMFFMSASMAALRWNGISRWGCAAGRRFVLFVWKKMSVVRACKR
jgi:hypothetical protein